VDRVFEFAEGIGVVCLGGGEPFLRKDLALFVDCVHKYKDKIDRTDIVTNGSVMPDGDVIKKIADYGDKIRVMVDNYGADISVCAAEVAEKIKQSTNAEVILRDYYSENAHCGGWVDYGVSPSSRNKGTKYALKVFQECAQVQELNICIAVVGGILYPCPPLRRLIELGVITAQPHEVINLFDYNYTDDEIRQRIIRLYSLEMFSSCAYCSGLCKDSRRFTPAEQLTAEELEGLRT
jgi:MoaA/NifB/PqqE/SkfB family radical SAM enzyme